MIYQHFPSIRAANYKPIVPVYPVSSVLTAGEMANGRSADYNSFYAKKKGCTVEEYAKRDRAYQDECIGVRFVKNDVVFPQNWDDYERLGKCRILKVLRSYSDAEQPWEEGKPLFVVEAASEKNEYSIRIATKNFFGYSVPVKPEGK